MHEPANTPSSTPSRDTQRVAGAHRLFSGTAGMAAVALVAAVAVMAVVVGVGWMSAASAAGSTVNVATNPTFGTILTDAQGFALYTFSMDSDGMSSCTGSCTTVWPALTVPAGTTPTAGTGVTGTVAAVLQANGTYQVTYNGSPLYTFVTDTPGQATGNGVGGFSIVKVAAAAPAPTSPPSTAASAQTSPPTTAAPTPTSSGGKPTTTAPATTPAMTPASSSPSPAAAAASVPGATTPASAPTALAFTGPGPALFWMAAVGAGLVALSLCLLVAANGRVRARTALSSATRRRS